MINSHITTEMTRQINLVSLQKNGFIFFDIVVVGSKARSVFLTDSYCKSIVNLVCSAQSFSLWEYFRRSFFIERGDILL